MKNYSIDSDVRATVLIVIVVFTLVLTVLLNFALSSLGALLVHVYPDSDLVSNIFFISGLPMSLSPFLLFGLIRWVFENHLWKCSQLKKLHHIPNLNGSWSGFCESSFSNLDTKYSASLEITQTFSKMKCQMIFESSRSHNLTTGLCVNDDLGPVLEFSYQNQADGKTIHEESRDNQHIGFNQLRVNNDTLDGWYVTGRNMMTRGSLHFERQLIKKS